MPKRIGKDWREFRDIISGKIRQALKKFIDAGHIFRARGRNGKISIAIPKINLPRIVYGSQGNGVGRGPGQPGDVVGEEPEKGQGRQAGQDPGEAIRVDIELEDILKWLQEDLKLPNMQPKENQTFEEIRIKYNNISKVGPKSLVHKRRTIKECIKRMMATRAGNSTEEETVTMPGMQEPVKVLKIIKDDFRFRQYNEIKIPSSNAVIFFARDGSGSMDAFKCDVVSDMCWWLDIWIRKFYKKTEHVYIWHDTEAREVSEKDFYSMRFGGGTTCSSALKLIHKIIKQRFPPEKWNIYLFYFSDGENWDGDNKVFCDEIKKKLGPKTVNLVGVTQIRAWRYQNSLRSYVDGKIKSGDLNPKFVKTTSVGEGDGQDHFFHTGQRDDRVDEDIKKAIAELLGANEKAEKLAA